MQSAQYPSHKTGHSADDQPSAGDLVLEELTHGVTDEFTSRRLVTQTGFGSRVAGGIVIRTSHQKMPPNRS
ncbi:hypothetical protein AWC13_10415 [Mycobacterium kubicae]|nr:hypothetical protein AWC13_10415 [Mycobacterium kubicae]